MKDMLFSGGQWLPADEMNEAFDQACEASGGDVGEGLKSLGFTLWSRIGDDIFAAAPVSLEVYSRSSAPHFYIQVRGNTQSFIEAVYAQTLPDAMELLARWAPIVQATSVAELIRLFRAGELEDEAKELLAGVTKRKAPR